MAETSKLDVSRLTPEAYLQKVGLMINNKEGKVLVRGTTELDGEQWLLPPYFNGEDMPPNVVGPQISDLKNYLTNKVPGRCSHEVGSQLDADGKFRIHRLFMVDDDDIYECESCRFVAYIDKEWTGADLMVLNYFHQNLYPKCEKKLSCFVPEYLCRPCYAAKFFPDGMDSRIETAIRDRLRKKLDVCYARKCYYADNGSQLRCVRAIDYPDVEKILDNSKRTEPFLREYDIPIDRNDATLLYSKYTNKKELGLTEKISICAVRSSHE